MSAQKSGGKPSNQHNMLVSTQHNLLVNIRHDMLVCVRHETLVEVRSQTDACPPRKARRVLECPPGPPEKRATRHPVERAEPCSSRAAPRAGLPTGGHERLAHFVEPRRPQRRQ